MIFPRLSHFAIDSRKAVVSDFFFFFWLKIDHWLNFGCAALPAMREDRHTSRVAAFVAL